MTRTSPLSFPLSFPCHFLSFAVISTLLVVCTIGLALINTVTKTFDFSGRANKHVLAANSLDMTRTSPLSLLVIVSQVKRRWLRYNFPFHLTNNEIMHYKNIFEI